MPLVVLSAAVFVGGKWPQSHSGKALAALSIILPFIPYVLLTAGLLLGWRFHQTGILLSAWLLGTAYWALQQGWFAPLRENSTASGCLAVLTCLLFFELAIFSTWRWRRLPLKTTMLWLLAIALQTAIIVLAAHPEETGGRWWNGIISSPLLERIPALFHHLPAVLPWHFSPVMFVFACTGLYLIASALRKPDVLLAGLLGMLLAIFMGLGPFQTTVGQPVFFSAAGLILVLAGVEASFFMAYRDELTGLPSRRALNQALSSLGRRYTIAMIDVDHFKKFNDTYGHKTGDQVLKLLASRLNDMSGGARPFRYGGEEFTAVFPGKSLEDALPHLDTCRKRLSETPFTVRGRKRNKASAGQRGKAGNGKPARNVRVTISIGAAESSSTLITPSQVILAADKALYRAKNSGRNCVRT